MYLVLLTNSSSHTCCETNPEDPEYGDATAHILVTNPTKKAAENAIEASKIVGTAK